MKFSKKIYNLSAFNLKKYLKYYLSKTLKKKREKSRRNYEHILLYKQKENKKFVDRLLNSVYGKLALLQISKLKKKNLSPEKLVRLFIEKIIYIRYQGKYYKK